jgi:hypothetical protein
MGHSALLNVCFHWLEYWEVMLHTRHIKHTICQGEFVFYKHGTQPTDAVEGTESNDAHVHRTFRCTNVVLWLGMDRNIADPRSDGTQ